jgi:WD40 repeat protein
VSQKQVALFGLPFVAMIALAIASQSPLDEGIAFAQDKKPAEKVPAAEIEKVEKRVLTPFPGLPWPQKPYRQFKKLPGLASAISFSPDELLMACSFWDGEILFWDLVRDEPIPKKIVMKGKSVRTVQISKCGKYFLTAAKGDGTSHLVLWDMASKKMLWECTDFTHLSTAAFFPDSKRIAALDFREMKIFSMDSNKPISAFPIDPGFLSFLDFSKDGKRVYTAGFAYGKFNVFDLEAKDAKTTVSCKGYPIAALLSLRGKKTVVLGGCNKPILFYSKQEFSEHLPPTKNWVYCLTASPDNRWLGVCQVGRFSLWNIDEEKEYLNIDGNAAAFSPTGQYLAVANLETVSLLKKARAKP